MTRVSPRDASDVPSLIQANLRDRGSVVKRRGLSGHDPDIGIGVPYGIHVVNRFLEDRARPSDAPPGPEVAVRGLETLARRFDGEWGGFGGAPKFPQPMVIEFLLRYHHLTGDFQKPLAWRHFKLEGMQQFAGMVFVPAHAPMNTGDTSRRIILMILFMPQSYGGHGR